MAESEDRFDHELFVGRWEAKELALNAARDLVQRVSSPSRVIRFAGPKGSGKSWLLCEIARLLRSEFGSTLVVNHLILGQDRPCQEPLYLPPTKTKSAPLDAVGQILESVAASFGLGGTGPTELDALSNWMIEGLRKAGRPLALLVDGIGELTPNFLYHLESYVLRPLVERPATLLLLGGRLRDPRQYMWKAWHLRAAQECHLLPFTTDEAKEQLERLNIHSANAKEIVNRGGGYPQTNYHLARHLQEGWPQALQRCADMHLRAVAPDQQKHFWALCVLEHRFDHGQMPDLLAAYSDRPAETWTPLACWRILSDMVMTRLVYWEEEEFKMDEGVRKVLEEALYENQRDLWKSLHEAAFKLYERLAERWPDDARWVSRQDHHSERCAGA